MMQAELICAGRVMVIACLVGVFTPASSVGAPWEASNQPVATLGLGMAQLVFDSSRPVYFRDQDDQVVDSITFGLPTDAMGLRTAPPWLLPEYLKDDYQALLLRVVGANRTHLWVVANQRTQRRGKVRREEVTFFPWHEFFLQVHSVDFAEPELGVLHARPFEGSSTSPASHRGPFQVFRVEGDWLWVAPNSEEHPPTRGTGWIRWRTGSELSVTWSLFS